jgi:hypothetical protein
VKRYFGFFAVVFSIILISASTTLGQNGAGFVVYKLWLTSEHSQRYLGDAKLGPLNRGIIDLSISSGYYSMFSLRLTVNNFNNADMEKLEINNSEKSLGVMIPAARWLKLKGVLNTWIDNKDSTVEAGGMYAEVNPSKKIRLETGMEIFFRHNPEVYYLLARYQPAQKKLLFSQLFAGYAKRYMQGSDEIHRFNDRWIFGGIMSIKGKQLGLAVSSRADSLSWDKDTRAWTVSFGWPKSGEGEWAPSMYYKYCLKPGSRYFMGMGALGGDGFPIDVINVLQFSGFRSLLTPARVVNNQSFDLRVINQRTNENGRFSWDLFYLGIDITDQLTNHSFEGSVYYTALGWKYRRLVDPSIGYTYSYMEDITFDTRKHKRVSLGHATHAVSLGMGLARPVSKVKLLDFIGSVHFNRVALEGGALNAIFRF